MILFQFCFLLVPMPVAVFVMSATVRTVILAFTELQTVKTRQG
jgi:hypothetical protein